jgi:hypothetical protein
MMLPKHKPATTEGVIPPRIDLDVDTWALRTDLGTTYRTFVAAHTAVPVPLEGWPRIPAQCLVRFGLAHQLKRRRCGPSQLGLPASTSVGTMHSCSIYRTFSFTHNGISPTYRSSSLCRSSSCLIYTAFWRITRQHRFDLVACGHVKERRDHACKDWRRPICGAAVCAERVDRRSQPFGSGAIRKEL